MIDQELVGAAPTSSSDSWATPQLAEFLAHVSLLEDEQAALDAAVERVAEALDAEIAAVVVAGRVASSIGFAAGIDAEADLLAAAGESRSVMHAPGIGRCATVSVPLEGSLSAA